jgi:hypothetical protein
MLQLLDSTDLIVNVDETWINETDFRSKKWRKRGTANSVPSKSLSLRISMIAALDT